MLVISADLVARMHAHLEAGYPHEACGILIGEGSASGVESQKAVKDLVAVPNVWSLESEHEGLRNRYLISPDDMARADRAAGKRGLDIVGFFHSHPDHPSRPSETDRENAWPNVSYVIVSVQQGRATTMNSWVLRDDREQFDEEAVILG